MDVEPAPDFLPEKDWQDYGYGIYSGRYGNIYTVRQMLQLVQRSLGEFEPKEDIWEHKGGIVDPFRPTLQPEPFGTVEEMKACRHSHLQAIAEMFSSAGLLIFTMGLTESYFSKQDGAVYPVCPGVSGGTYSDNDHQFINFNYVEVVRDFNTLKSLFNKINPKIRYMLTVSPVPLVATATDKNVGVATTYSKSVLRAAAGALSDGKGRVDYFPSYEIISMPAGKGMFYESDKRGVQSAGVAHVMANVLNSFSNRKSGSGTSNAQNVVEIRPKSKTGSEDAAVCDEELLAQFGR